MKPLACRPISLAVLALCATAGALDAQSSVWKITSGDNTLYLGGTSHVLRQRDYPLPAEFDVAFAASRDVYFETDVGGMMDPAFQMTILSRGMYSDGTTLDRVLSPEAWKAVQDYCAKAGAPIAIFRGMRPWMFTVTLASLELQKLGVTQEGVDIHYFERAREQGKVTHGLETLDEHLGYLSDMGAGHENEMVLSSIEELQELPEMFDAMLTAWKSGDLAKIDETMLKDMRTEFPSVYEALIVDRNRKWLPKIDEMLKSEPTEMVLVGAAHLAGPDGILASLEKQGYGIEQIVAMHILGGGMPAR